MPDRASNRKRTFLYPGTDRPFLLDTKEFSQATKRPHSDVIRVPEGSSVMNRVRNRMDVVLIGPPESRRQPTVRHPLPYVMGLEVLLKRRPRQQVARMAMEYSLSDDAQDRIREGRAYFKDLLDEHTHDGFMYSGDVTGMLNLWPEAVYHWQRTSVVREEEVIKETSGARELYVARSAVERLCAWRLPEALRESGIPNLPYPAAPQSQA